MESLWMDFANSMWRDWKGGGPSVDRLDQPEWRHSFTAKMKYPVDEPDPDELEKARALRDRLLRYAENLAAGEVLGDQDTGYLNQVMAQGPVIRKLVAGEPAPQMKLEPADKGWGQMLADVAADFARMLSEQEVSRIRCCDNPDCRWVFYDDTRSRTKRYCDDKMCGNLMKVRRHRARRKAEAPKEENE
ncbi:CGNR zinc finger domain-containing protein [Paenibacillus sp. P96]|uniref:CGNR zinc finger domain-containing protein n=1 Tax=Paenibacillus zeirhizosphaerae TaxID=2987519 RepID=A0ABT9FUX5_9BACL|nr:CGNR zinc finger domain-containing protein [Paenibacillus sp. P96]MDP4098534.1 CGNR zinc finger domain-containing protein [Paenibacillus sp. P96]